MCTLSSKASSSGDVTRRALCLCPSEVHHGRPLSCKGHYRPVRHHALRRQGAVPVRQDHGPHHLPGVWPPRAGGPGARRPLSARACRCRSRLCAAWTHAWPCNLRASPALRCRLLTPLLARHPNTNQVVVAQKVTAGVYKGVTTTELDELAAQTAAGMTSLHPDYAVVRLLSFLCSTRDAEVACSGRHPRAGAAVFSSHVHSDAHGASTGRVAATWGRLAGRVAGRHPWCCRLFSSSTPPPALTATPHTRALSPHSSRLASPWRHCTRRRATRSRRRAFVGPLPKPRRAGAVRAQSPLPRRWPLTPCASSREHTTSSIQVLYDYVNPRNGLRAPLIAEDVYKVGGPGCASAHTAPLTACTHSARRP